MTLQAPVTESRLPRSRLKAGAKPMMDTATSCRELAARDNAHAMAEPLDSRRAIFAASATAWAQRADVLERLDKLTVARGGRPPAESPE